ncbi:MAG: hypothetical protein EZS28_013740 [Streblomastix strix]|uniref:Uncharacterized protein n=1 Tax=Streblomastix strix TaxID=222440 RepID=A0A5J4W772_9EUKA|nr:MAG: hypothetical protein EZS28_013740 [Streblomastix strix]
MSEVLRQASIHPQSFKLSRKEFFDQHVTQLTRDGQRQTRAALGARGNTTCSMAQSCQLSYQITILKEKLVLQLNQVVLPSVDNTTEALSRVRVNFNGKDDTYADWTRTMQVGEEDNQQLINPDEQAKFWIGYSTACGPFQQIAICKYNTKLWNISVYAREQAVIAANSLSDLCTKNCVSVSSLESIVRARRYSGIFLDIPVSRFAVEIINLRFLTKSEGYMVKQMETDDSFMRGNSASKISARTNIQVFPIGTLTQGIIDNELIRLNADQNQNNLISFIATRSYPTPTYALITPQMQYLCDSIIRFTFDDAPDPQVFKL